MEDPGGLIQVIVFILITLGYAIVTIVKKANEWINTNRIPRHAREDRDDAGEGRPERPGRSTVLEELEKALREHSRHERAGTPPRPEPTPQKAEPQQARQEEPQSSGYPEARTRPRRKMRTDSLQPGQGPVQAPVGTLRKRAERKPALRKSGEMKTTKAAAIQKRDYGHLATLGNMDDLRRAILARQILEPCPAARRLPGRRALRP